MNCKICNSENVIIIFKDGVYCVNCYGLKIKEADFDPLMPPKTDWKFAPIEKNMAYVTDKDGNTEYRKITSKDWLYVPTKNPDEITP